MGNFSDDEAIGLGIDSILIWAEDDHAV